MYMCKKGNKFNQKVEMQIMQESNVLYKVWQVYVNQRVEMRAMGGEKNIWHCSRERDEKMCNFAHNNNRKLINHR